MRSIGLIVLFIFQNLLLSCSFESDDVSPNTANTDVPAGDNNDERGSIQEPDAPNVPDTSNLPDVSDTQPAPPPPVLIIDTDGDGIPDNIDPNPSIAVVPRFYIGKINSSQISTHYFDQKSLFDQEKELKYEPDQSIPNEAILLKKDKLSDRVNHLHLKAIINPSYRPSSDELFRHEDFFILPISDWRDNNFFLYKDWFVQKKVESSENIIRSSIQLGIDNLQSVTAINDIEFSIVEYGGRRNLLGRRYLVDGDGNKKQFRFNGTINRHDGPDIQRLVIKSVSDEIISSILTNRSELALKIENFKYNKLGIDLEFSKVLSNISENTSIVIFSCDENGLSYQFVKEGLVLLNVFSDLINDLTVNDRGHLLSVNGWTNTINLPADFSDLTPAEITGRSLALIGANSLHAKTVAGENYIISSKRTSTLTRHLNWSERIIPNDGSSVDLGHFYPGQILELQISGDIVSPTQENTQKRQRISWDLPHPRRIRGVSTNNITINSFQLNWEMSDDSNEYIVDVSENRSFTSRVAPYIELSVGNVNETRISSLKSDTTYYVRVRGKNARGLSLNSKIIDVKTARAGSSSNRPLPGPPCNPPNSCICNPRPGCVQEKDHDFLKTDTPRVRENANLKYYDLSFEENSINFNLDKVVQSIKVGGTTYLLKDLLPEKENTSILGEGKIKRFRIKVPRSLSERNRISIQLYPLEKIEIKQGFSPEWKSLCKGDNCSIEGENEDFKRKSINKFFELSTKIRPSI